MEKCPERMHISYHVQHLLHLCDCLTHGFHGHSPAQAHHCSCTNVLALTWHNALVRGVGWS